MVIGGLQSANEKRDENVETRIVPRRTASVRSHALYVFGLVALGLSFVVNATEKSPCIIVRQDGVTVYFTVELATSQAARSQGLMDRSTLPARHGMWFDFKAETAAVMWMKNTLLPLDMAFVDERGVIVHVHERTKPLSLEHLTTPQPARYVLEVNGGEFAALGIERGATVVLSGLSRAP
jgi:uncharacterized protein